VRCCVTQQIRAWFSGSSATVAQTRQQQSNAINNVMHDFSSSLRAHSARVGSGSSRRARAPTIRPTHGRGLYAMLAVVHRTRLAPSSSPPCAAATRGYAATAARTRSASQV
jgi:hypothetical protein